MQPEAVKLRDLPVETEEANGDLTPAQFAKISSLLHRLCGIDLRTGKEQLVKARLWKRIHALGLAGFQEYVALVEEDPLGREITFMVDALTTNKTSFFREPEHLDFLRDEVRRSPRSSVRVWSAGCSSGQEPYSIAITLLENQREAPFECGILATDISTKMLGDARVGCYKAADLSGLPAPIVQRHFIRRQEEGATHYQIADPVRSLVRFARLNLMEPWPMKGPFDFIFCRNVMIYFDRSTRRALVERFREMLRPGGHLFVGQSESLTEDGKSLTYVLPAVYRK